MSEKELQRFRYYEKLVKEAGKAKNMDKKPPSCEKCRYRQPDFKYRKCLFARCPFYRGVDVFRKWPLKKDKIPGPEVVKMDV